MDIREAVSVGLVLVQLSCVHEAGNRIAAGMECCRQLRLIAHPTAPLMVEGALTHFLLLQ